MHMAGCTPHPSSRPLTAGHVVYGMIGTDTRKLHVPVAAELVWLKVRISVAFRAHTLTDLTPTLAYPTHTLTLVPYNLCPLDPAAGYCGPHTCWQLA